MANWETSTQRKNWIFDAAALDERRRSVLEASAMLLQRFYEGKIAEVCAALRMPSKVKGAALNFFKRFMLTTGPLELDNKVVMLTCVYLACKIEESYISAEELSRQFQQSEQHLLATERQLLEALHFHFVTYSPYRSLGGLIGKLGDAGALQGGLRELETRANKVIDKLLLTDAPLLYPPGIVALGALVSAADTDPSAAGVIREFAGAALKQAASEGKHRGQPVASAEASLSAICALADSPPVSLDDVCLADRKLKLWRKTHPKPPPPPDGAGEAKKMAKAEARAKQAQAAGDAEMCAFDGLSPMQHSSGKPPGAGGGDDDDGAAVDAGGDVTMRSPKRRRSDKGPPVDDVMASV